MMTAMILAAGRGERMRPLTDREPKPLLEIGGRSLIERHLDSLAEAGFAEVVVNVAWLGTRIRERLGGGGRWGLRIRYSDEGEQALETAGGIVHALPLLGREPFVALNADVFTDYPFDRLARPAGARAHLVLVPNPEHHPEGDFALQGGRVVANGPQRLTFAGIGVYHPDLFTGMADAPAPLGPLLRAAIDRGEVTGERYEGRWRDIGTPERLAAIDAELRAAEPGTGRR